MSCDMQQLLQHTEKPIKSDMYSGDSTKSRPLLCSFWILEIFE